MKSHTRFLVLVLGVVSFVTYIFYRYHLASAISNKETNLLIGVLPRTNRITQVQSTSKVINNHLPTKHDRPKEIVVAVVACGDRLDETLVMIKSAILFTRSPLKFIVVADDDLIPSFREKLSEWTNTVNNSFTFEILPITFPNTENAEEWRKLFKPCASQRLFLPSILTHVDSLLYVDTDTLFLGPLEDVWRHFDLMNATQMAALTPEHEDPNTGWYNRFARHPYYGKLGVNSGVMLMNLTRMRAFSWTEYVIPIYKEYKLSIIWGDQDIINIIFHFHPDKLLVYPCRYNFRPDHCMYASVCLSAEQDGVAVLHGSRGSFHAEKQPAFKLAHAAMQEYQLGTEPYANLLLPMKNYLEEATTSNCGKVHKIFTKSIEAFLKKPNDFR